MPDRLLSSETVLTDAAVRGVVRLSRQVELALAEFELSLSQFRVLDRLAGGDAPGRSLAEWLAVKPPSITGLVDGLVSRELVARGPDASDRRRVTHSLTPSGRALLDQASGALSARLGQLVTHIADAARARDLVAALAGWNETLDLAREAKAAAARQVREPVT